MRGRPWAWSGDAERFLANLPRPFFRNRDAYDTADRMGIARWQGQGIWHQLKISGRIVRTTHAIGKSGRHCYWERSNCSIKVTEANRHLLGLLTRRT